MWVTFALIQFCRALAAKRKYPNAKKDKRHPTLRFVFLKRDHSFVAHSENGRGCSHLAN
jgi:hypothetical protein